MTRRRWIADEVSGNTASILGDHAAHLTRVLRAKVGQEFDIVVPSSDTVDSTAGVRRGTITSISGLRVEFELGEERATISSFTPKITLALTIFKFDRMEWAIEKCTELGVARIIPVIARRSDPHLVVAAAKRRERWERLARQASEQSRRLTPPEITQPTKLKDLGGMLASESIRVVLAESLANREAPRVADVLPSGLDVVALAIGPEGGWSGDELEWFHQSGWVAASLGNTILRAETAAVAATALCMNAIG